VKGEVSFISNSINARSSNDGMIDFSNRSVTIPDQNYVFVSIKLLKNNHQVASRNFDFGIYNKRMVPMDPVIISNWVNQFSYDEAKIDIPTFDIQSQPGVNTLISVPKFNDSVVATGANSWFCDIPSSGGRFFCQDQVGIAGQ
jgi:hypothetical protein